MRLLVGSIACVLSFLTGCSSAPSSGLPSDADEGSAASPASGTAAGGSNGTSTTTGSSDAGPSAPDPMTSGICAPSAQAAKCAPPTPIASLDELQPYLDNLGFVIVELGLPRVLRSTDDLVTTADIDVDASAITANATIDDDVATGSVPAFRTYAFPNPSTKTSVSGTSCLADGEPLANRGPTCAKLHIASGTMFRLRGVIESGRALVELVAPCSVACGTGEQRCGDTQTCFRADGDYCLYCDAKSSAICACTGACNVAKSDGATCSYATPDAPVASGTCRAGACTP